MRVIGPAAAALFFLIAPGLSAQALFPRGLEYTPGFDSLWPRPLAADETPNGAETPNGETRGAETGGGPVSAGAPRWAWDLRRGEIVFFGSFPFTVFFTRTFMDLYRCASNDWDRRYAPWPFKAAGAAPMSPGELRTMFGVAVSSSLVIAVADYLIVRHKRNRAAPEENGGETYLE